MSHTKSTHNSQSDRKPSPICELVSGYNLLEAPPGTTVVAAADAEEAVPVPARNNSDKRRRQRSRAPSLGCSNATEAASHTNCALNCAISRLTPPPAPDGEVAAAAEPAVGEVAAPCECDGDGSLLFRSAVDVGRGRVNPVAAAGVAVDAGSCVEGGEVGAAPLPFALAVDCGEAAVAADAPSLATNVLGGDGEREATTDVEVEGVGDGDRSPPLADRRIAVCNSSTDKTASFKS